MIRRGDFKPGSRLPSERRLTELFAVSQPTAREALRTLEAMGLVSIQHGSGIYVTDGNPLNGVWSTRWMQWVLQHAHSLLDHLEMQEAVEGKAAALAAHNARKDDLRCLQACLVESERLLSRYAPGNVSEALLAAYVGLDTSFHRTLARASRNDLLCNMIEALGSILSGSREATLAIPGRMQRSLAEHRTILDAVKRRDAEQARCAMGAHVRRVGEEVRSVERQSRRRQRAPGPADGVARRL